MDRAGKVLRQLSVAGGGPPSPQLAQKAWPLAVGRRIASSAKVIALKGTTLQIEVQDDLWQAQLRTLAPNILAKLRDLIGPDVIRWIDFRVVPARLPARRDRLAYAAAVPPPGTLLDNVPPLPDEADSIEDPVFRTLYRIERRRAQNQ